MFFRCSTFLIYQFAGKCLTSDIEQLIVNSLSAQTTPDQQLQLEPLINCDVCAIGHLDITRGRPKCGSRGQTAETIQATGTEKPEINPRDRHLD